MMARDELRRYVDDLLAGRKPKSFAPDDFEAAQMRAAIDLSASKPGNDEPRPEFLDDLKSRLAAEMVSADAPEADIAPAASRFSATRRQVIVGTTAAATAAVAAVSVDRLVTRPTTTGPADDASAELVPNDGTWRPIAASAALPEGGVRAFDLGSVNGFVRRAQGRVDAVSGVCTHQGCKLWFDQGADQLRCPCHTTSFSPAGQVITHALPISPKPLPHFDVREQNGVIEVLAPEPPSQPA